VILYDKLTICLSELGAVTYEMNWSHLHVKGLTRPTN